MDALAKARFHAEQASKVGAPDAVAHAAAAQACATLALAEALHDLAVSAGAR